MRRTFSFLNFVSSKNKSRVVERAKTVISQKVSPSTFSKSQQKNNQDHNLFFQEKACIENQKIELASDTEGKKAFDDDIACSQ